MQSNPSAPPPHPGFAVDARHHDEGVRVLVSGELDMATDAELRVALASVQLGPDGTVWLHLDELEFADAASVEQLLGFIRLARDADREVGIVGAQGVVLRMIHLLGHAGELEVA
jgi:anti-anti-sigma factor